MKKVLLLDVDDVICFSGYIEAINEYTGKNYTIDDFSSYYAEDDVFNETEKKSFYKYVRNRNFYHNAQLLPNALSVIKKLNKKYDVYICSSFVLPVNTDCCGKYLKDKYDFLYETLPFINPSHFIFTSNKKVFSADIRIDDRLNNLGNAKLNILFPSYHNKNIKEKDLEGLNIIRAGKSIEDAWLEIEKTLL